MKNVIRALQNRWDRKNMESLKRSFDLFRADDYFGPIFEKLEPHQQISTAERLVNMRKADITALRFYGLILVGTAGALKYLFFG